MIFDLNEVLSIIEDFLCFNALPGAFIASGVFIKLLSIKVIVDLSNEFSSAMSLEGGKGASVCHIGQSDNRGSGSVLAHQLKKYPNGTKYRIVIIEGD